MNYIIIGFSEWMKQTTNLSDASIYKYSRAVGSISNDMIKIGVITKPIIKMNSLELDCAIRLILENPHFIEKNTRGNNMYSNSLKQYRSYQITVAKTESINQTVNEMVNMGTEVTVTERESIIKSRVGQGSFRTALLQKYKNACIVTGISLNHLLIASHIKPWAVSTNAERLSTDNGLLLCANYDRLFDSGLISFNDNGKIIVSRYVDEENRKRLNICDELSAKTEFSVETRRHLEYHRDIVFLR